MMKYTKRLIIALMLITAIIATSTQVSAATDKMLKDKNNKLKISNDLDANVKIVEESIAAGKTLTYKIEVSKGSLYVDLKSEKNFKLEVSDSDNKLVKKIEGFDMMAGMLYYVRGDISLSKGKYKIKISPVNKKEALKVDGKIALIKNSTSATIDLSKTYVTAATNGKSYKYKFEVSEKSRVLFSCIIWSHDPDQLFPFVPEFRIDDSKGKTVKKFDRDNIVPDYTLEKGTYTLVVKANETGRLHVLVGQ